jgi:DNA polymerase III sliding clamp (beta) subunit (PCNA family)
MNKINLTVSELKNALPGFTKVINKRTTLPVLGCILFQSKQGQLQLTATNLDDHVSRTIETNGEFNAAIPYEALNKIVKGCAVTSLLTIEASKDEVRVAYPFAGTTMTERIPCLPVTEFPSIPPCDWQDSVTVGEDFKKAIVEALDSASTDESRFILNSAYVDVSDPKAHYIVATNGSELYSANSFQLGFKDSLIVPNRKFLIWKGFIEDGDWNIALSCPDLKKTNPGWIKVTSAQWTLITKQIDGSYPHWRAPIPHPQEAKAKVSFTPEAGEFVINAAPRLPGASHRYEPVAIKTDGNAVFLAGKDQSNEAVIPIVGATAEGENTVIGLNRQLLIKAMKLGLNTAEIHPASGAMPIAVFNHDGKRLVIAGLRPDVAEAVTSNHQPQPAPQPRSSEARQDETQPEEKHEMKSTNRIEATEATTSTSSSADTSAASAFVQVKDQLEKVRDRLKEVVSDLNDGIKLLSQAQKEKKATEREIESIRETLRGLQQVRI